MRKTILILSVTILATAFYAGAAKPEPKKLDAAEKINEPRPDSRKIAFTVNEGTWMSVDLSPDGSTLLFDLLGDLYTLPVAGGTASALTKGPAMDLSPRYSPDGKTIVFVSDRGGMDNLWLINSDGTNPRILVKDKDSYFMSPTWSPDGRYIVARKEDGKRAGLPPIELWMYHIQGGTGIKLTSFEEFNNASGPVVSPDGRYIYFSTRRQNFDYIPNLSAGLWQIMRYDRKTGETVQLTSGVGGAVRPAISPDGKTLFFMSRRDIDNVLISRNLETGAENIVVRGLSKDEQEGFTRNDTYPAYAVTRDGSSVVYWNHGKIQKVDLKSKQVSPIEFTANVEQWLAPRVTWQDKVETGPVQAKIIRWANQSPDGKWITYDALGRVWMQEISGNQAIGEARRLTEDDPSAPKREYAPAFSPDGKWIAYVTWSDAEGGQLWKTAADGSGTPQKLTKHPGHYANPEWSRQGDKIAVVLGSGLEFRGRQPEEESLFEIRWLPAEGGDAQYITSIRQAPGTRFHPQAFWNMDGTRVYYVDVIQPTKPTDDPKNELVSVRLDGTDKRRHLRFPAVSDVVPSPDEQWVAFTSRDNVYVTALPVAMLKEPPDVGLKEGAVPVWRLTNEAGGFVNWTDGGKTVTWTLGNEYHRLPITSAIEFSEAQRKKAEEKAEQAGKKDEKEKSAEAQKEEDRVPKSVITVLKLSVPRYAPEGTIVFKNARVITMKGEEVLENADVVVTGNRITSVGKSGQIQSPQNAKVIDAEGKTIIPGFIDTHAHLHYSGFEIFPDQKWEYIANLAYGVTTVYDPSAPTYDVFSQAEMVEAGWMLGPRVYSSGMVLYGGQPFDIFAEVNDQNDAKRQVKRMKAYGARMIKVYQQPRREQRRWFAEACRELKMLLTAEGAGEFFTDLSMALDGFTAFEHSLPQELRQDAVQLLAKSGTHYTPTLLVSYGGAWGELYYWQTQNPHDDPKLNRFVPHLTLDNYGRRHPWINPEEYHFPIVARGAAQVLKAGGNVSLGAHGQLQGLGVHWEIWSMAGEDAAKGTTAMSPMEALRASTILAADKIGFAPDLGSIETGKLADFMVLDADPLQDIHNTVKIKYVVKNGELFD
ncbi:MAG TPA: amidohydrolase family protein, partial [Acidobacteriota bacterium]|nr:amidohydrolase family protein [Acidobacteriota bacterium]